MSRRVILLVTLSVAAIFLASFVLLQGRSDFARPLFPKPWGSDSGSGSQSWLKEHLDGIVADHGSQSSGDGSDSSSTPDVDEHDKSPSPALADASDGQKEEEQKPSTDNAVSGGSSSTAGGEKPALGEAELDGADSGPLDTTIIETGGFHDEVIETWMLEVGGSHDEVIAALIHAFGSQRNVQIELFQRLQRFGIKDIFDQFELPHPLPAKFTYKTEFNVTERKKPRIVVSTTCELDAPEMGKQFADMLEAEQTYMFCVVHHGDRWVKNSAQRVMQPWVQKGLVSFLCLSKHTQDFLDKELQKWEGLDGVKPITRHFVPVFPVDLSKTVADNKLDGLSFAIQGNFESSRRDYKKIFDHMTKFLNSSTIDGQEVDLNDHESHPDIQLHLLGHGNKPAVPKELEPHVKFDERLDYLQFYGILSEMFAMLPGFANDEYYDRKASSTVPAAMIAGSPLVATQKLLDAYTYFPAEAVWLQGDDEEDFDVIGRILEMTPEERKKKKDAVKEANDKRVELNKVLVAEWIREGLAQIRKLNETKNAVENSDTKNAPEDSDVMEGLGTATAVPPSSTETAERR